MGVVTGDKDDKDPIFASRKIPSFWVVCGKTVNSFPGLPRSSLRQNLLDLFFACPRGKPLARSVGGWRWKWSLFKIVIWCCFHEVWLLRRQRTHKSNHCCFVQSCLVLIVRLHVHWIYSGPSCMDFVLQKQMSNGAFLGICNHHQDNYYVFVQKQSVISIADIQNIINSFLNKVEKLLLHCTFLK